MGLGNNIRATPAVRSAAYEMTQWKWQQAIPAFGQGGYAGRAGIFARKW